LEGKEVKMNGGKEYDQEKKTGEVEVGKGFKSEEK
jgi:hypothetical protein